MTGKATEASLGRAFITCNKNGVPNDPQSPFVTSGIRLGTPAATTRGFGREEFIQVGQFILDVVNGLSLAGADGDNSAIEQEVQEKVIALTSKFPIYDYIGA